MSKRSNNNNWSSVADNVLIDTALPNWTTLNAVLAHLSRRQVAVLLVHELSNLERDPIVKRLHQRLVRLRADEELRQLRKSPTIPPWLNEEAVCGA